MYTRVLVVEDHPAGRYLIKRILERLGCRVDSTDRIGSALGLAGERPYDIIFLDLSLPGLDAKAATSVLRGLQPNGRRVPIVGLTDSDFPQDRERLRARGVDDFVMRPASVEQFQAALKLWLDVDVQWRFSSGDLAERVGHLPQKIA